MLQKQAALAILAVFSLKTRITCWRQIRKRLERVIPYYFEALQLRSVRFLVVTNTLSPM